MVREIIETWRTKGDPIAVWVTCHQQFLHNRQHSHSNWTSRRGQISWNGTRELKLCLKANQKHHQIWMVSNVQSSIFLNITPNKNRAWNKWPVQILMITNFITNSHIIHTQKAITPPEIAGILCGYCENWTRTWIEKIANLSPVLDSVWKRTSIVWEILSVRNGCIIQIRPVSLFSFRKFVTQHNLRSPDGDCFHRKPPSI